MAYALIRSLTIISIHWANTKKGYNRTKHFIFLSSHTILVLQNKFNGSDVFYNKLVDSDNDSKETEKHKL